MVGPRVSCALAIALSLAPGAGLRTPSASAMIQAADSLDLDGEWRFDTEEVVRVTHDGSAVRAEFLEGAACFDGQVRPYFLDGVLSGTTLTGRMMVCSRNARLVEECGISSMYETPFEATVDAARIAGTRVAQGLATEESGGRYTSCTPDSRYDGEYDFEGTRSCAELERQVAEREAALEELRREADAIVSGARDVIDEVHLAAREHFGVQYHGSAYYAPDNVIASTDLLLQPYRALSDLPEETEAYFDALSLVTVDGTLHRWREARQLARTMAGYGEQNPPADDTSGDVWNPNPLPEARRIVEEMRKVEALPDRAEPILDALRQARGALRDCQGGEPARPTG